jgi:hypothetical protein
MKMMKIYLSAHENHLMFSPAACIFTAKDGKLLSLYFEKKRV